MKQYIKYWAELIKESIDDYEEETDEITSREYFSFDDNSDINSFEEFIKDIYTDEKDQNEAYEKVCRLLENIIKHVKCNIGDEDIIVASTTIYKDFSEELDYYNKELDKYGFELDIDDTRINYVHGDAEDTDVYFKINVTDKDKLKNFLID